MLAQFLGDNRGAMMAEYALMLALAFICLSCVALYLGDKVTDSIYRVAETITGSIVEIARGVRPS